MSISVVLHHNLIEIIDPSEHASSALHLSFAVTVTHRGDRIFPGSTVGHLWSLDKMYYITMCFWKEL